MEFLYFYIHQLNSTQRGIPSTDQMMSHGVLLLGHVERGPTSHLAFGLPQDSRCLPDPNRNRRLSRSLQRSLTADPLGIRHLAFFERYLIRKLRRVASPRRVWSRIQRFLSSLRDGSIGKKWRLFTGESEIFVRYKSQRATTFYQHREGAGSDEQHLGVRAAALCQPVHRMQSPNVLLKERWTLRAVVTRPRQVDAAAARVMPLQPCDCAGRGSNIMLVSWR